jgi:hypothetical protein
MAIWNISRTFGIFYNNLVHFVFIWYISSGFGIMHQKNLATPVSDPTKMLDCVHKNPLKATTLHPGGIRSHGPWLQSSRWQAETIPLDHTARGQFFNGFLSQQSKIHALLKLDPKHTKVGSKFPPSPSSKICCQGQQKLSFFQGGILVNYF